MNKLSTRCITGFFALWLLGVDASAKSQDRHSGEGAMLHLTGGVPSDVEQQWRRRYGRNPPSDWEQRQRRGYGYRNVPSDVEQRRGRRSGRVPSDLEQAWRRYGDGGPIPSEFEQQWRRGMFRD